MNKTLKIIPLGGCGEIGMNMTILQVDGLYYFIDCGSLFPDASLPGVDLILPEVTFLRENRIQPQAWLITHGHEDHIGALPHLFPEFQAPVYGTQFTLKLIENKFIDAGINNARMKLWNSFERVRFRNITVTPYTVNHSIAHAMGFFIETANGNILHAGDFRIDPRPPEQSQSHHNMKKAIAGKPVRIMLSDSTNSFSHGTDLSENDLSEAFESILQHTAGAVVVAMFASNVWRIQSVIDSAVKSGRKVFFLGRSLRRNSEIALELDLLRIPEGALLNEDTLGNVDRRDLCIICTGSQGEGFSGANRLAFNSFPNFRFDESDTFVMSARAIPGNEKSIGALINQVTRLGVRVVTPKEMDVHVSGHGYAQDLQTCMRVVNPECFMPVHGEYRHLRKHIDLAVEAGIPIENCFLVENGDVCVAGPQPHGVIDRVPAGRDYVCQGGTVLNGSGEIYQTRLGLARNGIITVSYVLKQKSFDLAATPAFVNRGVPVDEAKLDKLLVKTYRSSLDAVSRRRDFSEEDLLDELRIAIRRAVEGLVMYKCNVSVMLQRVGV